MFQIDTFFFWLFNTREGVYALVLGGIVLFMVIAFVLERKTRAQFKNHEKSDSDWSLFDFGDTDQDDEAANNSKKAAKD